ncbi:MAG: hypothetical protein BMS9Abin31_0362 [Gammaproteobacteria bacterium]|nr:MAG: hypothetical protein BMS9Abin31_0362 [Gammaproteobacteria bacterium]
MISGLDMFNFTMASIIGLFFSFSCFADSSQSKHIDSATGITSWESNTGGVNFSLTQILPEQAKAFYVNRGFTLKQTEAFASSCVYMTIMRNDNAPGTVHFVKSNWSVITNKKSQPLLATEIWLKRLQENKVNKPALIAFRWAQFPIEQEFEVGGDWNQGMISTGLPPDSLFDLIVRWDINGKAYQTTLRGVQCAK